MNKKLIYIGLDVDDTQYHGAALDKESGEIVSFKSRPNLKGLLSQLEKMQKYFSAESLKLCYEASEYKSNKAPITSMNPGLAPCCGHSGL